MAKRKHGTLTASTVATVALDGGNNVEVVNRGTVDIFARTDGTNPTVGGADDDYVIPAGGYLSIPDEDSSSSTTTVKLISSGTPGYSAGIVSA